MSAWPGAFLSLVPHIQTVSHMLFGSDSFLESDEEEKRAIIMAMRLMPIKRLTGTDAG